MKHHVEQRSLLKERAIAILNNTKRVRPVCIVAPRRYGKSTFVATLLDQWTPPDSQSLVAVRCDVRRLHQDCDQSFPGFLEQLGLHIYDGLPDDLRAAVPQWSAESRNPRDRLTRMLAEVLRHAHGIVCLTLERIDVLYEHHQQESLLTLVRSWAERRNDAVWAQLRLLLTVEIPPLLLEAPARSSLLEQAELIELGPLTEAEQQQFVSDNSVAFSHEALLHLRSRIGGHPLLWSRYISRAQALGCSLDQLLGQADTELCEQDLHRLQREIQHYGLLSAVHSLSHDPDAVLAEQDYARLYRLGVVTRERGGRFRFANQLFERYLRTGAA